MLLHFSEHHEVGHDCIGAEDKEDEEDHEEDDESGGSLNLASNLESSFSNHLYCDFSKKLDHFTFENVS